MADLFSAIWLEDMGKKTDENTLQHQFDRIKSSTPKLNIQQWGSLSIAESSFFTHNDLELYHKHQDKETEEANTKMRVDRMNSNTIDARDAKFNLIYAELIEEASMKSHLVLQHEVTHRMRVDHIF